MKHLGTSGGFWIGPISPAAGGPLYGQIVEGVKREVLAGRLEAGVELPSFRVLAGELMVSLITVKRAYEELERAGIIVRRQGRGTYVAEGSVDRSREEQALMAAGHFEEGVRAARRAGMGDEEVRELFRDAMNREESDE